MMQLVQPSNGVEPLPKRTRGAKHRHAGALVHAAIWLSVVALVAAAPPGARGNGLDAPAEHESTQDRIQSPLSVAPVVEVESPGQADCRISISQRESLPLGAYVRIRGLPAGVVLSAGRPWWEKIAGQADEQRAWVVPVRATEGLKVQMPRGVSGNSELLVTLVDGDGRMLAEDSSELRITPQVALAPAETIVSVSIRPAVAPPPEKVVVPSGSERVIVAAPPGARGNGLDAPAQHESTQHRVQSPLSVAPVVEVESPGQADCRISIVQRESLPLGAYVRIRGLPAAAVLSAGRPWWEKIAGQADEQRAWVVPVRATEGLKVQMPRGVSGNSELLVTLVDGDGRMLAEDSSELRITPQVALAPAEKIVSLSIEPAAAPPPEKIVVPSAPEKVAVAAPDKAASQPQRNPGEITTSALSPSHPPLPSRDLPAPSSDNLAQADRLVAKGESYLARGDIAIARRYFERAAELGLPIAALRMAETQDPRELARRGVHGVKANLDEARRWYQRALELNVPEADSKLRRLGSQ
jgi:Sel1 repeat